MVECKDLHDCLAFEGQTIAHVRATTGVYMKGSDVDEDNRLVWTL